MKIARLIAGQSDAKLPSVYPKYGFADAIPTDGLWTTGSRLENVLWDGVADLVVAWVCVEAGEPGVWKPVTLGSGTAIELTSFSLDPFFATPKTVIWGGPTTNYARGDIQLELGQYLFQLDTVLNNPANAGKMYRLYFKTLNEIYPTSAPVITYDGVVIWDMAGVSIPTRGTAFVDIIAPGAGAGDFRIEAVVEGIRFQSLGFQQLDPDSASTNDQYLLDPDSWYNDDGTTFAIGGGVKLGNADSFLYAQFPVEIKVGDVFGVKYNGTANVTYGPRVIIGGVDVGSVPPVGWEEAEFTVASVVDNTVGLKSVLGYNELTYLQIYKK